MLDDTRVSDRIPHGLFVGRQREMATLRASLEEALAGRGGLVMLVGEPGIGKTRTAQQLAVQAAERGAQVLWGRCEEEAGAPPLLALGAGLARLCAGPRHGDTLRRDGRERGQHRRHRP